MGSEGITPHIHNFRTVRSKVVSFTPRPLYLRGKSPRYPLDRRRGGGKSRSAHCGGQQDLLSLPEIETQFLGHATSKLVAIPTELYRLHLKYNGNYRYHLL
jgi:hypothetical protein